MKAATRTPLAAPHQYDISIHAAREGGDRVFIAAVHRDAISIHAAREGGDGMGIDARQPNPHFNPRRP